jgi:hypothetical protein
LTLAVRTGRAVVPGEAAEADQPPRLALQVADHVLVADLQIAIRRQHPAPVRHQRVIGAVVAAELGEIVGEVLPAGELLRIDREAGVDRSPPA